MINLDGTGLKQITTSPAEDHDPVWSPNGSTILFTRIPGHKKGERRSDGHLWTVRPDGTHLTRLTSGPVFDSGAWSPDSKRIIF
ncbi:MAG: PD40 domain-containing protein [Armatimonadetes bacterium]|nr:PD40 domain-containing protein [Armatimonadota bacterium]